jgi:hypothetical protein
MKEQQNNKLTKIPTVGDLIVVTNPDRHNRLIKGRLGAIVKVENLNIDRWDEYIYIDWADEQTKFRGCMHLIGFLQHTQVYIGGELVNW